MESDEGNASAPVSLLRKLGVGLAAAGFVGLSLSLAHTRSDLRAALDEKDSLQQEAQQKLKLYDSSVQSLAAALRRAQTTSKQTVREAEEQRHKFMHERSKLENDMRAQRAEHNRERAQLNATLRYRTAGARQRLDVIRSTIAGSIEQQMTMPVASPLVPEAAIAQWPSLDHDLRFAALKVTWRGERGATFRVLGESETELVAAVEDSPNDHDRNTRHAWLPCRPNQEYELTVQKLTSNAANLAQIPATAIHEVNFAKEPGPFMPGTRFAKSQKPTYSTAMPVSTAPRPTRLGRARCNGSVTVPATELLHPSSSSSHLIGGWRKEAAAFPSVSDVPLAAWSVGNLRQFAEEINGAWYGGKIFTRKPEQKIPSRKAFRWVPHEPTMSSQQLSETPRPRPWFDLLASTDRQGQLRQRRVESPKSYKGKFWIHIAGDSIGSGLATALALFFLKRSAKKELGSPSWKSYSTREGPYSCKNWERFDVEVGKVHISWIHWVQTRCLRGSSARPAVSQLIELGLWRCDDRTSSGATCAQRQAASNPTSVQQSCYNQCVARPDLLLLQSGLWDVQDPCRTDALAGEVDSLLRQLTSMHLRNASLAWLGPLAVWRASGQASWRTMHRLIEHANTLAPVLEKHGVPLINALQMFSGLPQDKVTPDGSHWHLDVYMDWLNVILNELGIMT